MSWVTIDVEGKATRCAMVRTAQGVWIAWPGGSGFFGRAQRETSELASQDEIRAPMTAKVVQVDCSVGDTVAEGDLLVVLEAMKMEYRLTAPHAGVVEAVHCAESDLVDLGVTLVSLNHPTADG